MGPSRWWYAAAALVAAVGVVASAILCVRAFVAYDDRIDGFQRISAPGSGTIALDEPGGYTVYFESDSLERDPDGFIVRDIPVRVTIDGVELDRYGGTLTYGIDGRDGVALLTFGVEEPGRFDVRVGGEAVGTVAIGRSLGTEPFGGLVRGLGVGAVAVLAGGLTFVVVAIARATSKPRFPPAPYVPGRP